jgi:hypothetical protein
MKNNMFKFGVTRSEIRQSAVEGCPLCRFIIECKNPDDCENEDDLALWGDDLSHRTDSFDIERLGFGWAKPSGMWPHLEHPRPFTVCAFKSMYAFIRAKL